MLEEEADEEETTVVPNVLFVPSAANIIIILLLSSSCLLFFTPNARRVCLRVWEKLKDMTRRDDESDETLIKRVFCSSDLLNPLKPKIFLLFFVFARFFFVFFVSQ